MNKRHERCIAEQGKHQADANFNSLVEVLKWVCASYTNEDKINKIIHKDFLSN